MKKFYILYSTLFCLGLAAYSQPGRLDATFGIAGKATTNVMDINRGAENINAVAVQPDGKVIVAGGTISPGFIFWYNTNGTLDNSFGNAGAVFIYGSKFTVVSVQADGKIVAAGDGFSLVRLNSNGTFDNSFGAAGRASIVLNSYYGNVYAMAVQADGKIILAGSAYNGSHDDCAIARVNTDGTPDNSFDVDGKLVNTYGYIDGRFRDVAVQADGKIVLAGYFYNGTDVFGVFRFNANGTPDISFDGDGRLSTSFGTSDMAYSVAIQPDGKILAAGYTDGNLAVARYTSTGAPDNSFDIDGKVTTITNSASNYPVSIALQSNGKIVVSVSIGSEFGLVRYNTDGSPDNSFDADGIATTQLSAFGDKPLDVVLRYDGRLIVGGFSNNVSNRDFSLACFNEDGTLNTGFDGDGKLIGYFGTSYDIARGIAFQSDGKIVVGGYTGTVDLSNNNDFALTRYNADGTLDNSFDGDGKMALPISSSADEKIYAVAVQSDGKILAVGPCRYSTSTYDVAVVRFNSNGTLDNNFDGDGIAIIVPGSGNDIPTSVALQSDGKILIAGPGMLIRLNSNGTLDNSFDSDGMMAIAPGGTVSVMVQPDGKILVGGTVGNDFSLARYTSNGNPDNTFDGDGYLVTDINSSLDALAGVALQADGKIVAAGTSGNNFAVVRYNVNGSLDNSFDADGKLTTDMGATSTIKVAGVALQSNGKIVVSGETRFANDDYLLARYNCDGTLDNSFDGDGKSVLDLGPNSYEHAWSMKINSNRIYVVGEMMTQGAVDFVVAGITSEPLGSSLPLQLRDFSGKRVNDDGLLTWITENESDMFEYIVERSVDGRIYSDIGTIAAKNRAGVHSYNFTDYSITSLNVATVYYRLREKGIDGKYTYSRIIALALDRDRDIVILYPNPVISEVNIALTVNRQDKLKLRIIDNKGRLVREEQWNVMAGSSSLSIDVSRLAAGMYYLEINGEFVDYRKQFIK